ncbi:MAG: phosphoribosylamine--glycine ligase [Bacillota bacterium]
MKVLIVGAGGREHALAWKLYESEDVTKIYVAPGSDAIAEQAEIVSIEAGDIKAMADFAEKEEIDLTVVGPEEPLVAGIVNEFKSRGLKIFGPEREAAMLEGSKVFAKKLLNKYDIPTAEYEVFTEPSTALSYLKDASYPLVIKAEGLAGGRGSVIATGEPEAFDAVERIMEDRVFGDAGERIVIENFLEGQEISIFALTDGKTLLPLATAVDYKAVFDGDQGPNTAGMGSYSPAHWLSQELEAEIYEDIMYPTLSALQQEGISFQGVLYAGLIITNSGPRVLEFNARFGDPETQAILPRLDEDLYELMLEVVEGRLQKRELNLSEQTAVTLVLASGGYPLTYETGYPIYGLDEAKHYDELIIFHAGTEKVGEHYVTAGGRVLNLTVLADGLMDAANIAYELVEEVHFEDMHYRSDIGSDALLVVDEEIEEEEMM